MSRRFSLSQCPPFFISLLDASLRPEALYVSACLFVPMSTLSSCLGVSLRPDAHPFFLSQRASFSRCSHLLLHLRSAASSSSTTSRACPSRRASCWPSALRAPSPSASLCAPTKELASLKSLCVNPERKAREFVCVFSSSCTPCVYPTLKRRARGICSCVFPPPVPRVSTLTSKEGRGESVRVFFSCCTPCVYHDEAASPFFYLALLVGIRLSTARASQRPKMPPLFSISAVVNGSTAALSSFLT